MFESLENSEYLTIIPRVRDGKAPWGVGYNPFSSPPGARLSWSVMGWSVTN